MEQAGEFAGKSVLVTGAGGGVGSALIKLFSERGARVIGCDMSLEAMTGDGFYARHAFDLLDREGLEPAAKRIIAESGLPDIVINNAGW
ncbi:SDR family NAD(P)-dependent oxidoreductase, partial [Brucella oryzae]